MIYQQQAICQDVLVEKYGNCGAVDEDKIFQRTAKGVAAAEKTKALRDKWEKQFYSNHKRGALGAGRIMSNAGTTIGGTLLNCFVTIVGDSIQGVDHKGRPGIYTVLAESAETMRRGGGVGYDFSPVRPRDSYVKGTQSSASGPCSYMDVFDKSCETVESAGFRRGAMLSALDITHPDIEEFIKAKRTEGRWNNFNVSVFVSDAFMEAVKTNGKWQLVHEAKPIQKLIDEQGAYQRKDGLWVYKEIEALDLWNTIMKSNYDYAEPGILFGDTINNSNNLRYVETITATNPCAEEPLPPYGCCCLGPLNLTKFISNPFSEEVRFDYNTFIEAAKIQVRFLDNVLDVSLWPLPQQKEEAEAKRRIGMGFTGLGNTLAMLNIKYNTLEARIWANGLMKILAVSAYEASVELAKEKGAFPLFNAEKYLEEGTFASTLPEDLKAKIRKYGIRNSHLLSVAPVGTISLAFCDNASNGLEPPFSLAYLRKKRMADGSKKEFTVVDHSVNVFLDKLVAEGKSDLADRIYKAMVNGKEEFITANGLIDTVKANLPESIVTAMEMSATDHVLMVGAIQQWNDTNQSKTVNIPADYPFEDFKNIYLTAYDLKIKGVATYRPNSILGSVLSEIKSEEPVKVDTYNPEQDYNTFMNTDHPKRPNGRLNGCSDKYEYFNSEGAVKFYVGASFIEHDIKLTDNSNILVRRPIELFINSEMNVGNEWGKLLGITMSQIARTGIKKLADYLKTCQKMRSDRGSIRFGYIEKANGGKAPRYHGSDIAVMAYAIQDLLYHEGIFDKHGDPVKFADIIGCFEPAVVNYVNEKELTEKELATPIVDEMLTETIVATGSVCQECGSPSVVKRDGCKFCTSCGWEGSCG